MENRGKPKSMKYSATIRILDAPNYSKILGEMHKYKRSSIKITEDKEKNIVFSISSKDITALRASINMLFRDLSIIESVNKI